MTGAAMTEACGAWCPFMACSRCKWQGKPTENDEEETDGA